MSMQTHMVPIVVWIPQQRFLRTSFLLSNLLQTVLQGTMVRNPAALGINSAAYGEKDKGKRLTRFTKL
jgi:hypothetical protein